MVGDWAAGGDRQCGRAVGMMGTVGTVGTVGTGDGRDYRRAEGGVPRKIAA